MVLNRPVTGRGEGFDDRQLEEAEIPDLLFVCLFVFCFLGALYIQTNAAENGQSFC